MKKRTGKKSKILNPINLTLFVLSIGVLAFWGYNNFLNTPTTDLGVDSESIKTSQQFAQQTEEVKTRLKAFSGEEFKKLYNEFAYPNTEYISENPIITGDREVDLYIQKFAENRGYKRRSAPVVDVFKTVQEGVTLQERAYQPWLDLQNSAKKDSIFLYLTAGYRSMNEQKEIFIQRFNVSPSNYSEILTGAYDQQLDEVLSMTAIPGYSRHHNGYTIDIGCDNQRDRAFEYTNCFEWLSRNNYEKAKTYGWIPSYPEEAEKQGPEPETWEYVWVSTDTVME